MRKAPLRGWLRKLFRRPSRLASPRATVALEVEGLELRTVPTIVFTPQFGPDSSQTSAPFNSADTGVMSSATVYLILWGPQWSLNPGANQVNANTVINEATAVASSSAIGVLKNYGADGLASVGGYYIDNSTPPSGFGVATGSGFTGTSYTQAEDEITAAITGGHLPYPSGNPKLASAPIYAIITDPNDSFDGNGNVSNGGVNRHGTLTSGPSNGDNINMIGVGTGNDSNFQVFSSIFSHELLEKMSNPAGRPGSTNPPAGYGVVITPPAGIPPFIEDNSGAAVTDISNWDQIADYEPEQGFTLNNGNSGYGYIYRVGGVNGVEVQAAYSAPDQAFVVDDGNSEVFTLTPVWTIDAQNANNDSFTGTYDLTINGDQLANADDNITISQDSAGGVQVDLNGQVANFDPGTASTIGTALRSITVNGGAGTNTLTLDFGNGNFLSAMNPNGDTLANGLIQFNGGSANTGELILKGGSFTNETDVITGANAGKITLDGHAITYADVAPHTVVDTAPATNYTFQDPNSGDHINVFNGPVQNGFTTTAITSSTDQFVEHDLANKTNITVQDTSMLGGATFLLDNFMPGNGLATLTADASTAGAGSTTFVTATAATVTTNVVGGAADTVTVGAAHSLGQIFGLLNVENPPSVNTLTLDDAADGLPQTVTLGTLGTNPADSEANGDQWGFVQGLAPADIRYEYGDNNPVIIDGGTGGDNFLVTAIPPVGTDITINGGSGTNALTGPNQFSFYVITGANSGILDGGAVSFSNVGNIVGGTGPNIYLFNAGASEGTITGGTNDLLIGPPDRINVWQITGANAGSIPGVLGSFTNIAYFEGSLTLPNTGTDVFEFFPGGHLSGKLFGGTGSEWLDYAPLSKSVRVNLTAGTASCVTGGVAHQAGNPLNVIGSAVGGDVLVGDATGGVLETHNSGNTLIAGSGRSILIGGFGKNYLQGGAGNDILIAGSTAYDFNIAALASILAEWDSAKPITTRIADLRTGGGLAAGAKLILGKTVFVPVSPPGPRFGRGGGSGQSTLIGGSGQDWFFTLYPTTIINRKKNDFVD